jgi:hypothetical protein
MFGMLLTLGMKRPKRSGSRAVGVAVIIGAPVQ